MLEGDSISSKALYFTIASLICNFVATVAVYVHLLHGHTQVLLLFVAFIFVTGFWKINYFVTLQTLNIYS